jgi:hypothetical protein
MMLAVAACRRSVACRACACTSVTNARRKLGSSSSSSSAAASRRRVSAIRRRHPPAIPSPWKEGQRARLFSTQGSSRRNGMLICLIFCAIGWFGRVPCFWRRAANVHMHGPRSGNASCTQRCETRVFYCSFQTVNAQLVSPDLRSCGSVALHDSNSRSLTECTVL